MFFRDAATLMNAPPQSNPEAEAGLIGAVLIDGSEILRIPGVQSVLPGGFDDRRWRRVWRSVRKLAAEGRRVDYTTVATDPYECRELDEVGGPSALSQAIVDCPSALHAGEVATSLCA